MHNLICIHITYLYHSGPSNRYTRRYTATERTLSYCIAHGATAACEAGVQGSQCRAVRQSRGRRCMGSPPKASACGTCGSEEVARLHCLAVHGCVWRAFTSRHAHGTRRRRPHEQQASVAWQKDNAVRIRKDGPVAKALRCSAWQYGCVLYAQHRSSCLVGTGDAAVASAAEERRTAVGTELRG